MRDKLQKVIKLRTAKQDEDGYRILKPWEKMPKKTFLLRKKERAKDAKPMV
jgi:hypothetical protein